MGRTVIEVEELEKRYGESAAVDGVSFVAEGGAVFGLLGPNGAGKSTTIGCISGLLAPSSGRIRVCGHDVVRDARAARSCLGVVPQELALYEDLSVADNAKYWGAAYGLRGAELRRRVGEVLERTGLADRARERVKTLSGGMKRRLNFGCGIVHRPRVLLLDEPTVGVDPQSRIRLLDLVREQAGAGTCVLYTTHYMEEAQALCERLAIMDHGRILAAGTLDELRGRVGGAGRAPAGGRVRAGAHARRHRGPRRRRSGEHRCRHDADRGGLREPAPARDSRGDRRRRRAGGRDHLEPAEPREPVHRAHGAGASGVSIHFALATARKDLRRRLADPAALLIWLALPVAIGGLLVLINSGDGGTPRGRLLVADEDRSFVSGLIAGLPSRGELAELFDVEHVARDEGLAIIDAGEATALVILPAGLQDAFVGKGSAEIRLVTHPAQRILPAVVEETLAVAADSAFYVERLFGEAARRVPDLPAGDGLPATTLSEDATSRSFVRAGRCPPAGSGEPHPGAAACSVSSTSPRPARGTRVPRPVSSTSAGSSCRE